MTDLISREAAIAAALIASRTDDWRHRDDEVKAALRALPAQAPAVKVKPLEWSTKCNEFEDYNPAKTYALGLGGRYCVDSTGQGVLLWGAEDQFRWTHHDTVKAAKAAAQADYAARILAAIEPAQGGEA